MNAKMKVQRLKLIIFGKKITKLKCICNNYS